MEQSLSIGSVAFSPPLVLAPMAGVTDGVFRRLVKEVSAGGLGLQCTEFVSCEGLSRKVPRLVATMRPTVDDHPVAVQLYGRDPARMAEAARLAEDAGADLLDINSGCPVRKVTGKGGGAQLMREPELLASIVAAVRQAVRCPVTVKIRAGWDQSSRNAVAVARQVVDAGAQAVTVHGRTRDQMYSGQADWDIIRQVREAVSVPVIGNGDISSPAGAKARWEQSGVAGLMIGRASLGNPWIFRQVAEMLAGQEPYTPTLAEKLRWWMRYGAELPTILPVGSVLGRMKQLAAPITRGLVGGAALRRTVYAIGSMTELNTLLERVAAQGNVFGLVEGYDREHGERAGSEAAGAGEAQAGWADDEQAGQPPAGRTTE